MGVAKAQLYDWRGVVAVEICTFGANFPPVGFEPSTNLIAHCDRGTGGLPVWPKAPPLPAFGLGATPLSALQMEYPAVCGGTKVRKMVPSCC